MNAGSIFEARHGATRVLRFVGEIRYDLGHSFAAYLEDMFSRCDFDDVVLDLTEATCVDSTCLGLLARLANFVRERFARKPVLFSTRADINEVLDSLGFDQVFTIRSLPASPDVDAHRIPSCAPAGERALAQTVLDAHRVLCALNEANRKQFTSVVEAINTELQRKAGE